MDRLADETEYVLIVLHQMQTEVTEHPEFFDPQARMRIDYAMALIQAQREVKSA